MPHRASAYVYVCIAHAGRPCGADVKISQSSRTTTVEANMKSEHNLYLACESSTTCFLLLHFLLFSSCPLSFYCTLTLLLSLSQCCELSAAFSTQLRKIRMLRRTSRIVLPSSMVKKCHSSLSSIARLGIQTIAGLIGSN